MSRKKVLIPIDDSPFSLQILSYVQELLSPAETELILLHVEQEPEAIHIELPGSESFNIYTDQAEESMRIDFSISMEPLIQKLTDLGFKATTDMGFGKPAQAIEARIFYRPVDMIAMTTHGRKGLDRVILGSVAEHILHHCHVPILLFHPSDEGQTTNGKKAHAA